MALGIGAPPCGRAARMACGMLLISLCALTLRSSLRGRGPAALFESVTMPCGSRCEDYASMASMPLLERVKRTMGKLKTKLRHLHVRTAAWRRRELEWRDGQRSTLTNVEQVTWRL